MIGTACLTKRIGEPDSGKYAILTVAHNFYKDKFVYKRANFLLQRNNGEYLANFSVKRKKIHDKYEPNDRSILEGFDIAVAEVEIVNKDPSK